MRDRCPIEGCGREARGEMCGPHWRRVPRPVQDRVWRTWEAFRAVVGRELDDDGQRTIAEYREARDAARAAAAR